MPSIDSILLKVRELQGLLWLKSAVKTIESNWAKRSQLEPASNWAHSDYNVRNLGYQNSDQCTWHNHFHRPFVKMKKE